MHKLFVAEPAACEPNMFIAVLIVLSFLLLLYATWFLFFRNNGGQKEPTIEQLTTEIEEVLTSIEENLTANASLDVSAMEYPPVLIQVNRQAGVSYTIKTPSLHGIRARKHHLSLLFVYDGTAVVFDSKGEELERLKSLESDKQRVWNDITSWKIITCAKQPDESYEIPTEFTFKKTFALTLKNGSQVIIEHNDFNSLREKNDNFYLTIGYYGWVRITENGQSTVYDSDLGQIKLYYTDVLSWKLD